MSAEPPVEAPARAERREPSLVVLHTGDGKGKTTAAMGIAMRAAGHGERVAVVQFMKSGRWKSGERLAAEQLGVDWSVIGDGFTWDSDDLERAAEIARRGVDRGRRPDRGGRLRRGRPGRGHIPPGLGMGARRPRWWPRSVRVRRMSPSC